MKFLRIFLEKLKKDENAEKMTDFDCKVEFSEITGQLVFLPCYIAMYKYEESEYFFVVSGQTGTTRGQVKRAGKNEG